MKANPAKLVQVECMHCLGSGRVPDWTEDIADPYGLIFCPNCCGAGRVWERHNDGSEQGRDSEMYAEEDETN